MLSKIVFKLEISQHCFIGVLLLHNVMLVSAVQQSGSAICTHMSPVSWASFPPLSPRPIITQLPVLHRSFPLATLVYTRHCLYVNATLPTHPTPLVPLWVHMSALYIRVSIPALEIGSFVPFLRVLCYLLYLRKTVLI